MSLFLLKQTGKKEGVCGGIFHLLRFLFWRDSGRSIALLVLLENQRFSQRYFL